MPKVNTIALLVRNPEQSGKLISELGCLCDAGRGMRLFVFMLDGPKKNPGHQVAPEKWKVSLGADEVACFSLSPLVAKGFSQIDKRRMAKLIAVADVVIPV